jgi:hypothetical protein
MSEESKKQLYVVSVTTEIVVLAESTEEAEEIAEDCRIDWEGPGFAQPMRVMPAGWDLDSVPFGEGDEEDPDRPLKGWIERGAAPEYSRMLEKLKMPKKEDP